MKKAHRASKANQKQASDYGALAMAAPPTMASGRSKKVKQVLSSLRIEKAKNGYTLNKSFEGSNGEYIGGSSKPEVFTDETSLMAAVTKALS